MAIFLILTNTDKPTFSFESHLKHPPRKYCQVQVSEGKPPPYLSSMKSSIEHKNIAAYKSTQGKGWHHKYKMKRKENEKKRSRVLYDSNNKSRLKRQYPASCIICKRTKWTQPIHNYFEPEPESSISSPKLSQKGKHISNWAMKAVVKIMWNLKQPWTLSNHQNAFPLIYSVSASRLTVQFCF